ncbi:hypothetical protein [Candidatus Rariloculus sp.]|uniref:hypothetical protein n=1 Tax=Candidatus Rariloculus sp. TaxID=3101265 RepID=UPI003D09F4D9
MLTIEKDSGEITDVGRVRNLALDIMGSKVESAHAKIAAAKVLLELGEATAATENKVNSLWEAIGAKRDSRSTRKWTLAMEVCLETFIKQQAAGVSMGELRSKFPEYSRNQLSAGINRMRKAGRVTKDGFKKGTLYLAVEPEPPQSVAEAG